MCYGLREQHQLEMKLTKLSIDYEWTTKNGTTMLSNLAQNISKPHTPVWANIPIKISKI